MTGVEAGTPGKELSAKEKKAAAKAAKAARRKNKVDEKGGPTEAPDKPQGKQNENEKNTENAKPKKNQDLRKNSDKRRDSDKEKTDKSKNSEKRMIVTKSQISQADLSEPLFTFMKNTFGVEETLNQLGFGLVDPFQKYDKNKLDSDGAKNRLHSSFVRLGVKSAMNPTNEPTERANILKNVLNEFINDFIAINDTRLQEHFLNQLKPNLNFLTKCRPFIRSEACLIDHLKSQARNFGTQEGITLTTFKEGLIEEMEHFWVNRVEHAQILIRDRAIEMIQDGSTIMTFGYSNSISKIFSHAKYSNIDFSVIVVDCEPDFTGKRMVSDLKEANIDVEYCAITGLSYMMQETDIIFLDANSLLANGSVEVLKGAGIVALVGQEDQKPVLVCCETYKFNERSAINALDNKNELGESKFFQEGDSSTGMQYANIVYDVIPSSLVTAAITEVGVIPSTSVATILGESDFKNIISAR